jgi:uncharacterized iron-regulated membrane protein
VLLFGITGMYLSFTTTFTHLFDLIEPQTDANMGKRRVDPVLYWLAFVHFGRFGGWKTEIPWAMFGLAPAVLFVTGVVMWWNRAVWPRLAQRVPLRAQLPSPPRRSPRVEGLSTDADD